MNKKHYQQSCGCLLYALMAIGVVVCAAARLVQEVKKRTATPQKMEQRQSPTPGRILPSHCR